MTEDDLESTKRAEAIAAEERLHQYYLDQAWRIRNDTTQTRACGRYRDLALDCSRRIERLKEAK